MRWKNAACIALLSLALVSPAAMGDPLEDAFRTPADSTRPRCYWYWLDGQVSKEGITKDLEAMKRVGIGEGMIGIIHDQSGLPENPNLKPLSDEWWDTITHAVREGTRLGVDIGFFNSPAWSQSGGPWVKPTDAMRYLTTRELHVVGPGRVTEKLTPQGPKYQPVAVLAFPAPLGDEPVKAAETRTPTSITLQMPQPIRARSLTVEPAKTLNVTAKLESSDDGQQWRAVREFRIDRHNGNPIVGPIPLAAQVVSFPSCEATFFRVTFSEPCEYGKVTILAAARVEDVMGKQLAKVFQEPQPPFDFYTWPLKPEPDDPRTVVAPGAVQNITQQVAADGTVNWDVPPGDWVIVQTGMVPTGTVNSPAAPELTGLEVDKMNRPALERHFDAYVGELLRRLPEQDRASLKHIVADSYEVGPENWTDGFGADFQTRYGYDPTPFLPVLSGRVVGSVDQSDRFLWDLRRLIADRIAHDYVGALRDECAKHGLKMWLENYGHWGFPAEFLQYGGASDEVGGEFWQTSSGVFEGLGSIELRDASSCAHTYGKNVVWAEAFTGGPKFLSAPADLKARGDWAFCQGINQFVLHVYIHQPDDRQPGISAWFGTEFNRGNTWFEMSKAWIDYLRRCSTLLQQGVHVADVAYFIGEDTPKMSGPQQPALPKGYDFDYINAEVLLTRAIVKDHRLVLPDGMSYRVLVLPPSQTMRPAVLQRIASFVDQGLTVVGPLPKRSPSLEHFPQCDAEVAALSAGLAGRVRETQDLQSAIAAPADVADLPGNVLFIHRSSPDAEIFFLSNPSNAPVSFAPTFRVAGMTAELWHAESGAIEPLSVEPHGEGTKAQIDLDPVGSVFAVFRKTAAQPRAAKTAPSGQLEIRRASYEAVDGSGHADVTDRLASLVSNGRLRAITSNETLGGDPAYLHVKQLRVEYTFNGQPFSVVVPEQGALDLPSGSPLPGPWRIEFPTKTIDARELTAWTSSDDPAIRYFSGTATYRTTFHAKPSGEPVWLCFGQVGSMAEVTLNGKTFTALWTPPYRLDVSSAIKDGQNTLEIRVVNTWHNALVGAALHPDQMPKPLPWTSSAPQVNSQSPLQPAGLIGPVRILGARVD